MRVNIWAVMFVVVIGVVGLDEFRQDEPPPPPVEVGTAQDDPLQVSTGYMSDDTADAYYTLRLDAGQAVLATAEGISGDLDTYLLLLDERGETLIENDDRDDTTFDSRLVYVVPKAGTYNVVVSNFPGSAGEYRLEIRVISAEEAITIERVELSGPHQIFDTPNFRIHYTTAGADGTSIGYVYQVAAALERSRAVQIGQLGWPIPPSDATAGGDARYDVYIADRLETYDGGDMGVSRPEPPYGDNPNTPEVEEYAVQSYFIIDNDYTELQDDAPPISLMRATVAHEYHHALQFAFDIADTFSWYYEATASFMEVVTFPFDEDASGYVGSVFTYPEVCFGAEGDADPVGGLMQYGLWLFIDAMSQDHGADFTLNLWRNIALYEAWEPLAVTLNSYGDSVPQAVARYHMRNLLRDYETTPLFAEETLWLEDTIDEPGEWTFTGNGIQELAANFYDLALDDGLYRVSVDNDALNLWMVGVKALDGDAVAVPLGTDGVFNLSNYAYAYLMVFNTAYDDDVTQCIYQDYKLKVNPVQGLAPILPTLQFDARHFKPLT